MEPHTITVDGKRYRFLWGKCGRGHMGHCDPPTKRGKEIRLPVSLKRYPHVLLTNLLHELLHAADWTKDEEWVELTAADLARTLTAFGFKRE